MEGTLHSVCIYALPSSIQEWICVVLWHKGCRFCMFCLEIHLPSGVPRLGGDWKEINGLQVNVLTSRKIRNISPGITFSSILFRGLIFEGGYIKRACVSISVSKLSNLLSYQYDIDIIGKQDLSLQQNDLRQNQVHSALKLSEIVLIHFSLYDYWHIQRFMSWTWNSPHSLFSGGLIFVGAYIW